MKAIFRILFICLILLTSCEEKSDQPYTLKYYGDAYEDIGYSVTIVNDGYVIAGQIEDLRRNEGFITSRNKNMGIIKTGWDGDVVWEISEGGRLADWGSKIFQLDDGSLICTGTFTDTTTSLLIQKEVFVVKISASGSVEWRKTYGGAGNQTGEDIIKTPEGFMVLGSTDVERQPVTDSTGNIAGNTDILLLKIKDNGDFVESFAYGYPGNDFGKVIKPDQSGGYVVFGTTDRSDPGQDKNNLILIRINNLGIATEPRITGGPYDEYAADMEVLTDGYLLMGTIVRGADDKEIFVSKLNDDIYSTPAFTKAVLIRNSSGTELSCGVNAMSKYGTDSYVVAGYTGTVTSGRMLIFEMDAAGNKVEGHEKNEGSTGVQVGYDVVSGDDGYVIAVGKNSYDLNSMITLLKFRF